MAKNYILLETVTVGAAGATSVTFNNIPQTGYTDLKIVWSSRATQTGADSASQYMSFNGVATNMSFKRLRGTGSAADSYGESTSTLYGTADAAGATASTFSNGEIYIPNYTSSNYKSWSVDSVTENNATSAIAVLFAGLWSNTAAITSIGFQTDGTYVQYSTFSLYGIAAVGSTPVIAPKATGGDIIQTDGTYWYHAFISSGTFTPAVGLSCAVLQVAGGGGGTSTGGGGGGSGGVLAFAAQSLAISTAYTVTVGAGGAAGTSGNPGAIGSNSQFASLTASAGGGGGGFYNSSSGTGRNGGSGGGGTYGGNGGTGSQGFNGGNSTNPRFAGGGGGGAGAIGSAASNYTGGAGGAGTTSVTNWGALSTALTNTGLGVSNYIAGGGGGGGDSGSTPNTGGSGGSGGGGAGGAGGANNGVAGTANTGSGGGSGGRNASGSDGNGAAGGSGVVIVRYLVA